MVVLWVSAVLLVGAPSSYAQQGSGDDPAARPSTVQQQALMDVAGPDRAGVDGPLRQVGHSLAVLHRAYASHRAQGKSASTFASPVPGIRTQDGRVAIDAIAREDAGSLLADLRRLGLRNGATAGRLVSGQLPLSAIDEAARLGTLHSARPVLATRSVGATTTQGVEAFASPAFRDRFGVDGTGARVGLISDSYDHAEQPDTRARDDIASGDLPGSGNPNGRTQDVVVVEESEEPESDEGRAMAQIVHDVAPGAGLLFHTAFNGGLANFAGAIRSLAEQEATVIVDDILFLAEPMFQDGVVAQAIDDVVFGEGIPYVSSAGNNARRSYESPFRNSGVAGPVSGGVLHDFDPGAAVDTLQQIRVPNGATLQVALHWSQPAASTGGEGAETDLEIFILDRNGETVGFPQRRSNIGGNPFEFVSLTNDSDPDSGSRTFSIGIERVEGPPPERIKYVLFSKDGLAERLEYADPSPTLYGHPNARGAFAVGASAYFNTPAFNDNLERPIVNSFTSVGGIPILFDERGEPLPGDGETRSKPDVTGPDGGNTTFFGTDIDDPDIPADDDSFPNFFGTSAAAPHVAGLLALMQDAEPGLSPRAYADALRRSTADIRETTDDVETGVGPDPFSGAGFVQGEEIEVRPLSVAEFSAAAVDGRRGALRVSWREREGAGVDGYVVERSFLGGRFDEVASIDSEGPGTYETVQSGLEPGVYDFRLRLRRSNQRLEVGPRTRGRVAVDGRIRVRGPYPNPVTAGAFRLELTVRREQTIGLFLYDAMGRLTASLTQVRLRPDRPRVVRIESDVTERFASGLYFVRVIGDEIDTAVPVTFVR